MVSIDAVTLKLIEDSDAMRQRYGQQAQRCGLPLIMRYLDIASDYEYRFRDANNKRLFVEVCIMKMAALTKNMQQPAS